MTNDRALPHFLLFVEARAARDHGTWRFVLAELGTTDSLSATDVEPVACHERLELFGLVRGLEAIDRPGRVTLVTNSRYLSRGLKRGLVDWRAQDWQWERFGQLVPVRNHDLWRRVDRALQFHELDCRLWRFEAHAEDAAPREAGNHQPATQLARHAHRPPVWRRRHAAAAMAAG